jgi:hypothetical protein
MSSLSVHWSPVEDVEASSQLLDGFRLVALWPSPVNHDICFREAGFTEFADTDDAWGIRADALLERLLAELTRHGEPKLVSEPVRHFERWSFMRSKRERPVGLREQLMLPILWDSLPECVVAFGRGGVTLRVGNGHHLFWLTLPLGNEMELEDFVSRVSGSEPCIRTTLHWLCLL